MYKIDIKKLYENGLIGNKMSRPTAALTDINVHHEIKINIKHEKIQKNAQNEQNMNSSNVKSQVKRN